MNWLCRALCFVLDRGLSKADYQELRKLVNACGYDILPSYGSLQAVKLTCRPDDIQATSANVVVGLQSLLNQTLSSILHDQDVASQVKRLSEEHPHIDFQLVSKWGLDGSKGHPIPKMVSEDDAERIPGALLSSHLVPLQLVAFCEEEAHIVFDNSACNSASACRPIRYWFTDETKPHVEEELERMEQEIQSLVSFQWTPNISISFKLYRTMCDGKISYIANDGSAVNCPFCTAKAKDFNDYKRIFEADPEALSDLCFSILHFGLRMCDHIFKVSFKLPIKVKLSPLCTLGYFHC